MNTTAVTSKTKLNLSSFAKESDVRAGELPRYMDTGAIYADAQIRKKFSEASIKELAGSIKDSGQLQAIIVRPGKKAGTYVIVFGERRWRACVLLKMQVLAIVREYTDAEARKVQWVENIQREALDNMQIAAGLQEDLVRLGSVGAVAREISKPQPWVTEMLQLLDMSEEAADSVKSGVTADPQAINKISRISKIDPAAAKALVADLKTNKGGNVRKVVGEAIKAVKKAADPKRKQDSLKLDAKPTAKKVQKLTAFELKQVDDGFNELLKFCDKAANILKSLAKLQRKGGAGFSGRKGHEDVLTRLAALRSAALGLD